MPWSLWPQRARAQQPQHALRDGGATGCADHVGTGAGVWLAGRTRGRAAVGPAPGGAAGASHWWGLRGTLLPLLFTLQPRRAQSQATYPSEFRFSWCVGDACFDHSVSAAHFQLRLARYYRDGSRPPIREAFFVATLPPPYQKELLYGCPGLTVLAHLLLAEARLYTHAPEEAGELVARAGEMLALPEITGPHLEGIKGAWPLAEALHTYELTAQRLEPARRQPQSVDFVLPRCREDLSWLTDHSKLEVLPERTRIFVYEKCGEAPNFTAKLAKRVTIIHSSLEDAVDPQTGRAARRDECTAYLAHVVQNYNEGLADMTLFLHGDPSDHTPWGLLALVLRGLALGTLRGIGFMHLGAPRLVHTANPCQAGLFEAAMGRPQKGPLSTYCCSQFAVARERILERPLSDYIRMLRLVDGSIPDLCERVGPAYELYRGQRLSHCYFFEFMWHVIFGEGEELPLRADDVRLPVALRLKDNEESLPELWRSYLSPFVSGKLAFQRQGHERWLQQLLTASQVEGRVQVNYGDVVTPTG